MKAARYIVQFAALALVLQVTIGVAHAQQHPIVLKSLAERDVEVRNAQGGVEKKRVPLTKAVPGDEVIYTTTFTNQGAKPAGDVVITNPVPANTTYVSGSAFGDKTAITFSVDGGKTYGAPDTLTIKTPDGRERPALARDYTHIHWVYQGKLGPGATGSVGFRVILN